MSRDFVYVVDPATKSTIKVDPTSFFELNVKERQDLQEWLINCPEVLGEPLLLISSEFDQFNRSDRRLDLLLIDQDGTLVIAELKLDAAGSLADQQAIRYAAFCSTMTMDDVVQTLAQFRGVSIEEASEAISQFVGSTTLPELTSEPRIILAAGSFRDQELTATVLWLRKFGLNISCVELTPYRYPGDSSNILLVPKVLIPLAEARSYQISVERKDKQQLLRNTSDSALTEFWRQVRDAYLAFSPELQPPRTAWKGDWYQITFGSKIAHYVWMVKKRRAVIEVSVHFEYSEKSNNISRMHRLLALCPGISEGVSAEFEAGEVGGKTAFAQFVHPYDGQTPSEQDAKRVAELMVVLIQRTLQVLREMD